MDLANILPEKSRKPSYDWTKAMQQPGEVLNALFGSTPKRTRLAWNKEKMNTIGGGGGGPADFKD